MAPHSSVLAWKIPWTEEPGGLQSMGLQRVGGSLVRGPSVSLTTGSCHNLISRGAKHTPWASLVAQR